MSEQGWHRLDLRMLLVHPINQLGRFAVPLIVVVIFDSGDIKWWQITLVLAPLVLGVWNYFATSYRITGEHVELRNGLLGRSVTRARLDKVRTVTLEATVVHRILRLSKVDIGTGDHQTLELNSLATSAARTLRADLLRRTPAGSEPAAPEAVGSEPTDGHAAPAPLPPTEDESLLQFDPKWLVYAPFTGTGVAIAGAAIGAIFGPFEDRAFELAENHIGDLEGLPIVGLIFGGVLLVGLLLIVLSIAGYALTNWGFHFSRTLNRTPNGPGQWHVRKGLLSTTESSLDVERVRGLSIQRGLGLRLMGGATLKALVVGGLLDPRTNAQLAPPTAYDEVNRLAHRLTDDHEALDGPLIQHGPEARRRQLNDVAFSFVVGSAIAVAVVLIFDLSWWWLLVPVALIPIEWVGALDCYAGLGHRLTAHHLVISPPRLNRRRQLLLRTGIISWQIEQTYFQRRKNLVSLTATTAAGSKAYEIVDLDQSAAVALADQAVPGLISQFLADDR